MIREKEVISYTIYIIWLLHYLAQYEKGTFVILVAHILTYHKFTGAETALVWLTGSLVPLNISTSGVAISGPPHTLLCKYSLRSSENM
jgi:hypothetical protein